jgi:hypothetical protein
MAVGLENSDLVMIVSYWVEVLRISYLRSANKKLASVCVRARIGHA